MTQGSGPDLALAAAVRRLRTTRGMTLEALAHPAGVTTDTVGRIERAQSEPAWMTVRAIARGLRVSLVELAEAVEAEASRK